MKRIGKRTFGILIAMAMLLAVLPGMGLTAQAVGHEHSFNYSASGATLTAACTVAGCSLPESKVTLTIGDPTNIYYNDKNSPHDFTLVGLEAFNRETGKTISASDLVYYKGDNTTQDIKNNNVKGATYKARLTVEGARAEHSFTFQEKKQPISTASATPPAALSSRRPAIPPPTWNPATCRTNRRR